MRKFCCFTGCMAFFRKLRGFCLKAKEKSQTGLEHLFPKKHRKLFWNSIMKIYLLVRMLKFMLSLLSCNQCRCHPNEALFYT